MTRFGVRALVIGFIVNSLCLAQETLRISIVDLHGAAVPGATVTVGEDAPRRAGPTGTVETAVRPPVLVRVSAPGFMLETRRLEAWPEDGVEIVIRPESVYQTVDVMVRREEVQLGPADVSAVEIDQTGARTVFDAVDRLIPSAFVTRRGVMGYGIAGSGTGQVTVRGVGNSPNTGVLVVVDGRPDYMGMMGHPLPDFYSLPDAESVSVTKGPASVLYGSNAMGGAINIKPSRPVEGLHTELSSSLGSYWTGQHRFKHGGGFPKWFYNVAAGVDHTNGHRPSSHFRNQDGTVALGYNLSDVWRTSLRGRYGHFVVEDPGVAGAGPGPWASVGRGGFSWNIEDQTNRVWGNTRVFGSWGHHHIDDGWRSNDRTVGLRTHQNFIVNPSLLVDAGGDFTDYGGEGRNVNRSIDYGSHTGRSGAGFSRVHWSPLSAVRLNGGFRYEHNSIFGGIAVPEFGATFGLREGVSLNLSAARGFRNPTIRELYLFPAPNPNLEPEHMWNYQATFAVQPNRRFSASLTGYYADLDNAIIVTGRFPDLQLLNGGRTLNRGLDGTVRWRFNRRLSLTGGYAWLRSTNLMPYVPRHKATYAAEVDLGRAFFYFGGMTVGSRWANAMKTAELDGYTTPTVKFMVPLNRRLTLFGAVDNLFNEDYQVITGYPMPKLNASGGFTLRF